MYNQDNLSTLQRPGGRPVGTTNQVANVAPQYDVLPQQGSLRNSFLNTHPFVANNPSLLKALQGGSGVLGSIPQSLPAGIVNRYLGGNEQSPIDPNAYRPMRGGAEQSPIGGPNVYHRDLGGAEQSPWNTNAPIAQRGTVEQSPWNTNTPPPVRNLGGAEQSPLPQGVPRNLGGAEQSPWNTGAPIYPRGVAEQSPVGGYPIVPRGVAEQSPIKPPIIPQKKVYPTPNPSSYVASAPGTNGPMVDRNSDTTQGKQAKQTKQYYSPELEGLKHSALTQDWFGTPDYANKLQGYQDTMATPVTQQIGLSDQERQAILNQQRANIMGTTKALQDQAGDAMAGRGYHAGDSGIADTAIGQIGRQGIEQYGQAASNLAIDEAKNRFGQGLALNQMNTERLKNATGIAQALNDIQQGRAGTGLAAGGFGAQLEQFRKQLAEQATARSQSNNQWGQEFQYKQENDALNMLLGLSNQAQNYNQGAYNQYYQGLTGFTG